MKDIRNPFSAILKVFRIQTYKQLISGLLLVAFLPLATSSCNYYRLKEDKDISTEKIASLPNYKRFILHQDQYAWELKDLAIREMSLTGKITPIPEDLVQFVKPKVGSSNRYKRSDKAAALNIVHLYVNEFAQGNNQEVVIPVSSVKRMDITDKDSGATVASHIVIGIGGLVVVFTLISIIALLLKSSCPFVYVQDGNGGYHFEGEAYGGAIFSPLERDDYMPLRGWDENARNVQIKIANELKERQYTNLAELQVVEHDQGVKVLLDQQGRAQTLQQIESPLSALTSDGEDYTAVLKTQDSSVWSFNQQSTNLSHVELQFRKPTGSKAGKLVLHAQNSLWLDYLYGEFTQQFGSIYNYWAKKQKDVPATELYKWQEEQGIPLLVEVQTAKGWQVVERIQPVGPLASRDLVIPLNLAEVKGENVKVRLSCGFMFWEIDKAGMDFTPNLPLQVQRIPASSAFEKSGQNVKHLLAGTDSEYLQQFSVGDAVLLTFPLPKKAEGQQQTVFLHTRGYYEHIREYSGIPNLVSLRAFEKPGRFMEFSRQRYEQLAEKNNFNTLITAHAPAATPR